MLKGIPKIVSPELLKTLCEMGHGDRILIADGNFPCNTVGKDAIVIRCDGHGVPELLDAVLSLIPLDDLTDKPARVMQVTPGQDVKTPIWETFYDIIDKYDSRGGSAVEEVERYACYDLSRTCYAIIATSESALYANIMLQKGTV